MNLGGTAGIKRLHQVNLDRERPLPEPENVFIHILLLRDVASNFWHAEHTLPQRGELALVQPSDGHLLQAKHAPRTRRRGDAAAGSPQYAPGGGATAEERHGEA